MASMIDQAVVQVRAGHGGHGCTSVHREKFKPLGGPDGGSGGHGGHVIVQADAQTNTLLEYQRHPHQNAANGEPGRGSNRHGKKGDDLILPVPTGTVIKNMHGDVLADLNTDQSQYIAAFGGQGGLGNAALASARRKAPGFSLLGTAGEEHELILEIKALADIAFVGYPSAGKSSLIGAISAARPKIAAYPFTTLTPHLGVVQAGDGRFTVADVPGLIPGASAGKGLGHDFLRHIERCAAIVHVLDCTTLENDRDPLHDLKALETELSRYPVDLHVDPRASIPLHERPALVALNKVDDPDGKEMALMVRETLQERGYRVLEVSALTREGLRPLIFAMAELVKAARQAQAESAPVLNPSPIHIRPVDERDFHIEVQRYENQPLFRIYGSKPEKWVQQTDFTNDEAIGYLAERLYKLGVEDELFARGATPGASVVIGPDGPHAVVFTWEPTLTPGAEMLAGPRGSDTLLNENHRPTRVDKKRARACSSTDDAHEAIQEYPS